ncbi:MAG: hypothetical protein KJ939_07595 [Nanoarchaeota archaeon]|nr:hypothetical protein [Nanoarchaeota archaeon]
MNNCYDIDEMCPLCKKGQVKAEMLGSQKRFIRYTCPICGLTWQACREADLPCQKEPLSNWKELLCQD